MLGSKDIVDSVLADLETSLLSEPEKALLRFVQKVNHDSYNIQPADIEVLHRAGHSDEVIYYTITVCALFNFYNRWIDASGVHAMSDEAHAAGAKRSAIHGYSRSSQPPPSLRKSSRAAVLTTACCGVFVSFASIVVYTFGVFLKPLANAFHWSRTEVSLAFTVAALTVAVSSPLIGRLLDRFPARRVVIPCTVVYASAFASLAFLTPHLWHLYAMFVVIGIVGNGTTQLGYARVVSAWFDNHRGRALAAAMAGSGLGSVVFPPAAQALISAYGWRIAYAVLGAFIFAIAVPLATFFLHEPPNSAESSPAVLPGESALSSILSKPFLGIALALLLFSFATNGLNAHWVAMLTDAGVTPDRAALVLSVAGFAALIGKLGTGYILDRFRAGRATAILLLASSLGFVCILTPGPFALSLLSGLLIGVGMGAESDAVPYLLTRYFGLSRFSELYGYTWCVYAIAGATGPAAMGAVFDHTGSYRPVLLASLAMVLAAALLFAMLPSYRRSEGVHPGRLRNINRTYTGTKTDANMPDTILKRE